MMAFCFPSAQTIIGALSLFRFQQRRYLICMTALITPAIRQSVEALHRRKLALPALLLLAGHRPLAFAAGQVLAVVAPAAALLELISIRDWAALLSTPEGPAALHAALMDAARTADEP